jgi:hypothetical protein
MAKSTVKKAPVRKKAVARKATPVRKEAVAKKAVPKKATPVAKKAVAKKVAVKKAAPVATKAVAKKAAPVAKKAAQARKKAAAKKAAPIKPKKVKINSDSIEKPWLQTEQDLPVFLKEVQSEIQKEPISTQGYSKKKSRKPAIIGFASLLLLLGVTVFAVSNNSISNVKSESQNATDAVVEESTAIEGVVEENAPTPTPSPSSTSSSPAAKATLDSFAPREFTSNLVGQEISFAWIAPAKSSSVVGYELSTKKMGSNSWVVISSMTTQQLLVSVDLISMDSTSQYKIASILENGKLAFNKVVISHPGVVD